MSNTTEFKSAREAYEEIHRNLAIAVRFDLEECEWESAINKASTMEKLEHKMEVPS